MSVPGGFTDFTGLSVNGAPLSPLAPVPGLRGLGPTGRVFYVCSLGGSGGSGDGTRPDSPLLTLGGANGALARLGGKTNSGDVIVCLPGHVESVSSADYFSHTGAASGFSVYGWGTGTMRPTFNWTVAGSTWLVDTANVEIANCILNFAVTAATVVVTPITVSAAGARFVNNYINWGASTTVQCGVTLGAIAFVAAAQCDFIGNTCVNLDVAGTTGGAVCLVSLNGADYFRFVGNKVTGATTATAVGVLHCVTTLSKNITVAFNSLENLIASSTVCLSSAIAGVTGQSFNNSMRVNSGIVAETASANWSVTSFNNYTADTVNLSGALDVAGGASS